MIKPRQLSNRKAPIVNSVKEATQQAIALVQQQSGLPLRELYAEETCADERIFVAVKHTCSDAAFHFEFTTS